MCCDGSCSRAIRIKGVVSGVVRRSGRCKHIERRRGGRKRERERERERESERERCTHTQIQRQRQNGQQDKGKTKDDRPSEREQRALGSLRSPAVGVAPEGERLVDRVKVCHLEGPREHEAYEECKLRYKNKAPGAVEEAVARAGGWDAEPRTLLMAIQDGTAQAMRDTLARENEVANTRLTVQDGGSRPQPCTSVPL